MATKSPHPNEESLYNVDSRRATGASEWSYLVRGWYKPIITIAPQKLNPDIFISSFLSCLNCLLVLFK